MRAVLLAGGGEEEGGGGGGCEGDMVKGGYHHGGDSGVLSRNEQPQDRLEPLASRRAGVVEVAAIDQEAQEATLQDLNVACHPTTPPLPLPEQPSPQTKTQTVRHVPQHFSAEVEGGDNNLQRRVDEGVSKGRAHQALLLSGPVSSCPGSAVGVKEAQGDLPADLDRYAGDASREMHGGGVEELRTRDPPPLRQGRSRLCCSPPLHGFPRQRHSNHLASTRMHVAAARGDSAGCGVAVPSVSSLEGVGSRQPDDDSRYPHSEGEPHFPHGGVPRSARQLHRRSFQALASTLRTSQVSFHGPSPRVCAEARGGEEQQGPVMVGMPRSAGERTVFRGREEAGADNTGSNTARGRVSPACEDIRRTVPSAFPLLSTTHRQIGRTCAPGQVIEEGGDFAGRRRTGGGGRKQKNLPHACFASRGGGSRHTPRPHFRRAPLLWGR